MVLRCVFKMEMGGKSSGDVASVMDGGDGFRVEMVGLRRGWEGYVEGADEGWVLRGFWGVGVRMFAGGRDDALRGLEGEGGECGRSAHCPSGKRCIERTSQTRKERKNGV